MEIVNVGFTEVTVADSVSTEEYTYHFTVKVRLQGHDGKWRCLGCENPYGCVHAAFVRTLNPRLPALPPREEETS